MKPVQILTSILSKPASKLVDSIGNAFDKNFTTKEERMQQKNKLVKEVTEYLTEVNNKVIEFETEKLKTNKELALKEMDGNFLQRSWRPIIHLGTFLLIILTVVFGLDGWDKIPPEAYGIVGGGMVLREAGKAVKASKLMNFIDKIK